jgi:tRNA (guanine10-N2)-methyltransferase
MKFLGDIDLKKPDVTIGAFEEYSSGEARMERGRELNECRGVWMGRKVSCMLLMDL